MSNSRKSIQEAKDFFLSHGCELLEDQYVNAKVKMRYRCSCGNESQINFNNFKSGKRCGCGRDGARRLTEQEIAQEVELKGCKFISTEFQNGSHYVRCVCPCGTEKNCQLTSFRNGIACRKCRDRANSLDIQMVRDLFRDQGCELLENQYINARTKMKYRCSCGNEAAIVFDSFKRGNRCRACGNRKIAEIMRVQRTGPGNHLWIADRSKRYGDEAFANRCRTMVKSCLKSVGIKKDRRTEQLLGYKFSMLKEHLEKYPGWDEIKNEEWEIDHIFPIKAFCDYGIKDMALINGLDNLRPLIGDENRRKQGKYDKVAFEKWLLCKSVNFISQVFNEKGGV